MSAADTDRPPLVVVVGSGGVGKTTLAAAMGLASAREGRDTLVMTFDPSQRLRDTLGVAQASTDDEIPVAAGAPGALYAGLLDSRRTFDRLVERYAPDEPTRRRILDNRFYHHLAGRLAGVLEYMAVERLYEVWTEGRFERVILDTPPAKQAIDFIEAPDRIVGFLESGALRIALKPWFDERGHLRGVGRLGFLGRRLEAFLDRVVGLGLLQDMSEFFLAFAPLFDGFRQRAAEVRRLLSSQACTFVLVSGAGEERIPDTMFFARRLREAGYGLGSVVVNRVHPRVERPSDPGDADPSAKDARRLLYWLGERDHDGVARLRAMLPDRALLALPLLPSAPTDLDSLAEIGETMAREWVAGSL